MRADRFVPLNERRSGYIESPLRRSATERHSARKTYGVTYGESRPAAEEHPPSQGAYHREPSSEIFPNTPGSFPPESWSDLSTPVATADSRQSEARDHTLKKNIEVCVSHLKALGFGDKSDRDGTRLRVYAEASNGNLEDAIEMIEEERKAYEQRSSLF